MRKRGTSSYRILSGEHGQQVRLFQWAAAMSANWPELEYLFAIPNGGLRHPAVAIKLRQEGVKPGVPDVFLPVPGGGYHGLFLEMKWGKNRLTDRQENYREYLQERGYRVVVAYNWNEAADAIEEYMQAFRKVDLMK